MTRSVRARGDRERMRWCSVRHKGECARTKQAVAPQEREERMRSGNIQITRRLYAESESVQKARRAEARVCAETEKVGLDCLAFDEARRRAFIRRTRDTAQVFLRLAASGRPRGDVAKTSRDREGENLLNESEVHNVGREDGGGEERGGDRKGEGLVWRAKRLGRNEIMKRTNGNCPILYTVRSFPKRER